MRTCGEKRCQTGSAAQLGGKTDDFHFMIRVAFPE